MMIRLTSPGTRAARAQRPQEMSTCCDFASPTASALAAIAVTNMALVTALAWKLTAVKKAPTRGTTASSAHFRRPWTRI